MPSARRKLPVWRGFGQGAVRGEYKAAIGEHGRIEYGVEGFMGRSFDEGEGHRHFSAACFNRSWEFLEEKNRSAFDNERMIQCAHASLWHWFEREDLDAEKRSVGYWLLARVYAEAGVGDRALHYGGLSLEEAEAGDLAPFYLAYACEAVARGYKAAGRGVEAGTWKERAKEEAGKIADAESRGALEADLATI